MSIATAAHAALPPWVYQKGRAEAPYHVQVAIETVKLEASPGNCWVTGKLVRIFRDTPGKLVRQAPITFADNCIRKGDEAPIGGTFYKDLDGLMRAKFIEAYLKEEGGRFLVVLSQSRVIDAPSEAPQLPVE